MVERNIAFSTLQLSIGNRVCKLGICAGPNHTTTTATTIMGIRSMILIKCACALSKSKKKPNASKPIITGWIYVFGVEGRRRRGQPDDPMDGRKETENTNDYRVGQPCRQHDDGRWAFHVRTGEWGTHLGRDIRLHAFALMNQKKNPY